MTTLDIPLERDISTGATPSRRGTVEAARSGYDYFGAVTRFARFARFLPSKADYPYVEDWMVTGQGQVTTGAPQYWLAYSGSTSSSAIPLAESSGPLPAERARAALQKALRELHNAAAEQEDWDSYGGRPTTPQAMAVATNLLNYVYVATIVAGFPTVVEPFEIAPTAGGGLLLGWKAGGDEIEVHVKPDGRLNALEVESRSAERQYREHHQIGMRQVLSLIAGLFGGTSVRP